MTGLKNPVSQPGFLLCLWSAVRPIADFACKSKCLSPAWDAAADLCGDGGLTGQARQKKGRQNRALLTRVKIGPGFSAAEAGSGGGKK
jgi:hypothetical protein